MLLNDKVNLTFKQIFGIDSIDEDLKPKGEMELIKMNKHSFRNIDTPRLQSCEPGRTVNFNPNQRGR